MNAPDHVLDTVLRLIFDQGEQFTEKEITHLLGREPYVSSNQLKHILQSDFRFQSVSKLTWDCSSWDELVKNESIQESIFVITDIETTGPIKGKDRVIDLAAVKVKGSKILGHFEQLVNPEIPIPIVIKRLTGITDEMVQGQPIIEEVLPAYLEFLGEDIFVAHNAFFDYSFLNAEALRLGLSSIDKNLEICTLKLANKILPNLQAKGLNGLAKHFGYDFENRHRAMSDVLATKFFLDQFFDILINSNIQELHQLLEFQKNKLNKREYKKKLRRIRKKNIKKYKIKHKPSK